MTEIFVLQSLKYAVKLVRLLKIKQLNKGVFVSFVTTKGNPSLPVFPKNITVTSIDSVNFKNMDDLLRGYIDMIAQLADWNQDNKPFLASDLISKNRFASPLSKLLSDFIQCLHTIDSLKSSDQFIILLGPPPTILMVLKEEAKKRSMKLNFLCLPGSGLYNYVLNRLKFWPNVFRGMIVTLKYIHIARKAFRKVVQIDRNKPIYLIKSFVYARSFKDNNSYSDPFFGELVNFLKRRLPANSDIYTVALGLSDKEYCYEKLEGLQNNVIPLEYYLRYRDIFYGFLDVLRCELLHPVKVKGQILIDGHNFSKLIRELVRSEGKKFSFFQYLHGKAAERISKMHSITACVYTYEGIPWERMFVEGIRKYNPEAKLIGVQHSVIPQSAVDAFVSKEEVSMMGLPDRIVTTGEIPKAILERYGSYPAQKIFSSCALRYPYLFDTNIKLKRNTTGERCVLVALEGVKEVLQFLEYVLEQAEICNNTSFLIRCHPILPFEDIVRMLPKRTIIPKNVIISDNNEVINDACQADVLLYWGTAVAVEAIKLGLPVIHFNRGDFFSYDPLFELTDFKWTVNRGSELSKLLIKIWDLTNEQFEQQKTKARTYVRGYFNPITDENLAPFISNIYK